MQKTSFNRKIVTYVVKINGFGRHRWLVKTLGQPWFKNLLTTKTDLQLLTNSNLQLTIFLGGANFTDVTIYVLLKL